MSSITEHGPGPWWGSYLLTNPLRRLVHHPNKILSPFVRDGMQVLEPGPGRGFFTLEMARLVGPSGKVFAPELQPRMIEGLKRRAKRVRLLERIEARQASRLSLNIDDLRNTIDFALAFAVAHETAHPAQFFAEIVSALKPRALLLLVEPEGHVHAKSFDALRRGAINCGVTPIQGPNIEGSHLCLLQKQDRT